MDIKLFENMLSENVESIQKKIRSYKYISFDIFDTLVKRDVADSKLIFKIVDKIVKENHCDESIDDFFSKRVTAEMKCRKLCGGEEIFFDSIYDELALTERKECCDIYKKVEMDVELSLCQANHKMKQVYDWCIKNSKVVVITSDMYLPNWFIEKILIKNGFVGHSKLYLSSECNRTKSTGNLFKYVLEDLNIHGSELVHIGDNFKSDYINAIRNGIVALKIKRDDNNNILKNSERFLTPYKQEEYLSLTSFINNHCIRNEDNYFQQIGYEALGSIFEGFSQWLHNNLLEQKIDKVFFLSRDGQILQKTYKLVFGTKQINNIYMYASRRALIVPTLWMCNSLEEIVNTMFFPKYGTIGAFLEKVGLEKSQYTELVKKIGLEWNKKYIYKELFTNEKFIVFFNLIKDDITSNSKKEFDAMASYLKEISFCGKVAIVDIGWHGNMQKALVKVCKIANIDVEIHGFYIGLNPNVKDLTKYHYATGYLFDKINNQKYFEYERNFNSIFEMMLTADHGSVRKYVLKDGFVDVEFKEFEYQEKDGRLAYEFVAIKQIQEGALRFINDVNSNTIFRIGWHPNVVFQNLLCLGNFPCGEIANRFGNFRMFDDDFKKIASPKSLLWYVFNPFNFVNDFKETSWRIGFLKRLFMIKLPYYDLYMLMRKFVQKS